MNAMVNDDSGNKTKYRRNFRNGNMIVFAGSLAIVDWGVVNLGSDLND